MARARGRCDRRIPRHSRDRRQDRRPPLNRYGPMENFPSNVLGEQRDRALFFKKLATLCTDAPLFKKVETLRWRGATPEFAASADRMEAPRLLERCDRVKLRHAVLRE
jgi:hypothetical protein